MTENLMPCPFCNGKKLRIRDCEEVIGTWEVACETCRASSSNEKTKKEAIKAWNKRAGDVKIYYGRINGRTMRRNIVREIIQERIRQITDEGYSMQHDDELDEGQLAEAGSVYASTRVGDRAENYPSGWVFKPTERRRELIKAMALIMAEIERLDRKSKEEKE